jgi:hypothetical protein
MYVFLTSRIVFRIPPLKANEGYRANDWGNLAEPLWKGRLRIIENSKGAALHLEDSQTGLALLALFEIHCSFVQSAGDCRTSHPSTVAT